MTSGRTERVHEVMVVAAGGPDDIRAERPRDLHGQMTEAAGRGGDQHGVPGLDAEVILQALLRGQRVDRHRGRVDVAEPGRDRRHLLRRARHVLRVAAGKGGIAVDRLAVLERGVRAGVADDQPGELTAGDDRQLPGQASGRAATRPTGRPRPPAP